MKLLVAIPFILLAANSVFADALAAEPAWTSFYNCRITAIGEGTLTVHTLRGPSGIIHPVNVDAKTVVVLFDGKPGKLSDLKVGQWIKAYWIADANDPKQQRLVKIEPGMPSWAAQRLADLEMNAGSLALGIQLFVNGKGDEEELNLLGPEVEAGYKEPFFASLTKDEMTRLLRYLAVEGFLDAATDRKTADKDPPAPAPPYLSLSIGNLVELAPLGSDALQRLEGIKAVLPEKAKAKLEGMLLPRVRKIIVANAIADLASNDGKARVAATKAIFALGKEALQPLQKAGAKQITPTGTIISSRRDMVYSLLDGLTLHPLPAGAGYRADGFGIRVENGVTQEDVAKMGKRHGFTIDSAFDATAVPACYVKLAPGKNLADVIKAVLSEEQKVISVNLNYFER